MSSMSGGYQLDLDKRLPVSNFRPLTFAFLIVTQEEVPPATYLESADSRTRRTRGDQPA